MHATGVPYVILCMATVINIIHTYYKTANDVPMKYMAYSIYMTVRTSKIPRQNVNINIIL